MKQLHITAFLLWSCCYRTGNFELQPQIFFPRVSFCCHGHSLTDFHLTKWTPFFFSVCFSDTSFLKYEQGDLNTTENCKVPAPLMNGCMVTDPAVLDSSMCNCFECLHFPSTDVLSLCIFIKLSYVRCIQGKGPWMSWSLDLPSISATVIKHAKPWFQDFQTALSQYPQNHFRLLRYM